MWITYYMPINIMCHKRDILYVYAYYKTHYVKQYLYKM